MSTIGHAHNLETAPLFIAVPAALEDTVLRDGYKTSARKAVPAAKSPEKARSACARHHFGDLRVLRVKSLPEGTAVTPSAGGYNIETRHLGPEHLEKHTTAGTLDVTTTAQSTQEETAKSAPARRPEFSYLLVPQGEVKKFGDSEVLFDAYSALAEHVEELARLNATQRFPGVQRFAVFRKSEQHGVQRRLNGRWGE